MGIYINKGNEAFRSSRKGEYVDKSGLIAVVNETLGTEYRFSCVSRCRRFGKSMAAKMLAAYYDKSCDSRELFSDLMISRDSSFEEHLNRYPVIYLDITGFITRIKDETIVNRIDEAIQSEVRDAYPQVRFREEEDLMDTLIRVAAQTGDRFFFIIDEWDAICREFSAESAAMNRYVNWLRRMFKDVSAYSVFSGVYMTGILPIKKYNTQSALNNFQEYSVIDPGDTSQFFGFTKMEVEELASDYHLDFDKLEEWYGGYCIGDEQSIFNPYSLTAALDGDWCTDYWGRTASYDAIVPYIQMDFKGLRDDIIKLLSGGCCKVNTNSFKNDLSILHSRNDVLTALIHLGYLSYDWKTGECYVPNREVFLELSNAVEETKWELPERKAFPIA